mmetsp:Transcript_16940/g.36731  ORF Transcript_16940/g.36731 Transcript_16940/m.36731 type:complete len:395 (-) Transcript_16940:128-1312(-)
MMGLTKQSTINPSKMNRIRRIILFALLFVCVSLYNILFDSPQPQPQQKQQQQEHPRHQAVHHANWQNIQNIASDRLNYIRLSGNKEELLGIFEQLDPSSSSPQFQQQQRQLPKTPQEIALKYGIPQTSRNIECNTNGTTTIGWIPNIAYVDDNDNDSHGSSSSSSTSQTSRAGRIPRLIFQSWKTTELKPNLCRLVLEWSRMNPEYDYFLFDDDAADAFVRTEYGREIFSSYACVKVGAAKCDVWRLLVIYLFGGIYFDADVRLRVPFEEWDWGNRSVVTARSCTAARKKHPGGCAHQWGLIYAPHHPVIYAAIRETLTNLAERKAKTVYDVSFWSYYNAWRNGPYNQSYMPGWGEEMGGRVSFQDNDAKDSMVVDNGHWQKAKQIWHSVCVGG